MSRHTTPLATHNSPLYFGNIGDIEAPAVSQVIGGQISGSGITGNRPGQGSGGGGAGGPGGPGDAQLNPTRADVRPAIGGGLDRYGRPWTGGSLDPSDKDYHLGRNAKPASVCCLRTEKQEANNHKSILKGVLNCPKLTAKTNLLLLSRSIWSGFKENGFDSYFYVQDARQAIWINLFEQPDALSHEEIEAHEEYLRSECLFASDNLDTLKTYIYHSCENDLISDLDISVNPHDGGVMVWSKLSRLLQGQKTSKMMKYQDIINNTKLVDYAGLNVTSYHKVLVPSLDAAHTMGCLPLGVGPTVLKNHAGPKDASYNALLSIYIADQTRKNSPKLQYLALKEEMVELSNVYNDSKNDWVMVEKNAGGYMGALQMDDTTKKNTGGRKCFKCGSPDHFKKQCPEKKATGGSGKGKKGGNKSPDKTKWQSVNKDNKATMKRDGTKYYWCKWCGYGAGRWVTSHKSEDCRFKKKKDDTSDDDEEVVAAEIAECLTIL